MKHLVLIGFMGSGKSSLALKISQLYSIPVFSTDSAIIEEMGMSISDIFKDYGEKFFRLKENKIFAKIRNLSSLHIIDCGGGFGAYQNVTSLGKVIFLDLEFEEIMQRMSLRERFKRPLFDNLQSAYQLFLQRRKLYAQRAEIRFRSIEDLKDLFEEELNFK